MKVTYVELLPMHRSKKLVRWETGELRVELTQLRTSG